MHRSLFTILSVLVTGAAAHALPAHPWATERDERGFPSTEIAPDDDDEIPTPEQLRREAPSYPTPEQMRREAPSYPPPEQLRREAPSVPLPQALPPLAPQAARAPLAVPPRFAPRRPRSTRSPTTTTHSVVLTPAEAQVWLLLNNARRARGLAPLRVDPIATQVARAHSADMCRVGTFSHVDSQGRQPWHRLSAAGARFVASAENIAAGYPTAFAAHQGWMRSPGHRTNRLDGRYRRMGVGVVRCGQTSYWTELFLR